MSDRSSQPIPLRRRWQSVLRTQRTRLFTLATLLFVVSLAAVLAAPTISFGAGRLTLASGNPPQKLAGNTRTEQFPPNDLKAFQRGGRPGPNASTGNGDLKPPITYGAVETNPIVYLVFWGSVWSSSPYQADANGAQSFFEDLSNTPYEAILTQYYDLAGPHISSTITLGGVYVDTNLPAPDSQTCKSGNNTYPGPTYNTSTIHTEIANVAQAHGWTDGNATIMFYLPPNAYEQTCGCGYHDVSGLYAGGIQVGNVADAIIPYPQSSNGCFAGSTSLDHLANVSAHEDFESITDRNGGIGWLDASGAEIGDKCESDQIDPKLNVQLHSHQYQVQPEYSNAIHDCSFGYPAPAPTVTPTPPPPPPTATPTRVPPTATPSGGHYEGNRVTSTWAGWEAVNWHAYSFARASWVLPSIPARNYSDMTMWVGYNGDTNEVGSSAGYFARAGVDASVDDVGDIYYSAFWEVRDTSGNILAQNQDFYPNGLAAGQQVSVNVWYDGSTLHFDFTDNSTGWSNSGTSHTYYAPGWQEYTTDWIVSNEGRYLANWNTSGFTMTDCTASSNNANWYPINANAYYSDSMQNSALIGSASAGSLTAGGTQFSPVYI